MLRESLIGMYDIFLRLFMMKKRGSWPIALRIKFCLYLKVSYVVMLVLNFSCSRGWLSALIFLTSAMLGHKCALLYLVLCSAGTKFGFHAWSTNTLPTKLHTQHLLCFCFSASIFSSSNWSQTHYVAKDDLEFLVILLLTMQAFLCIHVLLCLAENKCLMEISYFLWDKKHMNISDT